MSTSIARNIVGLMAVSFTLVQPLVAHSPPPVLNPKTYTSASGEYRLEVDPSTMYGQGEGFHRLLRGEKEVWAKTLPFTLWDAAITDDGVVAGYAYTNGYQGFPSEELRAQTDRSDWSGFFHTLVIDPSGEFRLNQREKREHCRFIDCDESFPLVAGMFIDPANDRFVLRMSDPDLNRREEEWRILRLSDGKQVTSLKPGKSIPGADQSWHILDARPLSGTPLTLVAWYVYAAASKANDARFTLVDPEGRVVWMLHRPGEYSVEGDDRATWAFRDYLHGRSPILDAGKPKQFEVWLPGEKARVTFEAQADAKEKTGWRITEVARKPHAGLEVPQEEALKFESVALKHLGTITLQARSAAPSAIRNLSGFDIDEQGRIGFVRYDEGGDRSFVVVKPSGDIAGEVPLTGAKGFHTLTAWLGGERWVVLDSSSGVGAKATAWIVQVGSAEPKPVAHFECPSAKAVAGTGDGGFVVLATNHYEYTMTDELDAFDKDERHRWKVEADSSKESGLFSPDDAAVIGPGLIAIVDNIRKSVQLFDQQGKYLRSVDLKESFGQEPSYPTGIAADRDGGFIIHDFSGTPPIWRLKADGRVLSKFDPKFADGRKLPVRSCVKVAPDGRLWATDGDALLRLTDEGVVDQVLGKRPDTDALVSVAGFTIDHRGRFYAVSSRSGVVQVFDRDGKLDHVCKPAPADFPSDLRDASVAVAGDGSTYVKQGLLSSRYVHFGPDGRRVDITETSGSPLDFKEWHFKPGLDERWEVGWQEFRLLDKGGAPVRTVKRRPDRNWLEHVDKLGVARDGAVAVCSQGSESRAFTNLAISLYSAAGDPIRTIPLPFTGYIHRLAYDGQWILLAREGGLVVLDAAGESIRSFVPEGSTGKKYWEPFFSPDGKELWLHESGSLSVERYELPSAVSTTQPTSKPASTTQPDN